MNKENFQLGVGAEGRPGKRLLVKSPSASDYAELRELYGISQDEATGLPLVFGSIDSAVGACRANLGDLIVVAPGHTETISSATALKLDVAGIKILGLGHGSARPTITLDTATTTTIPVSAGNIEIENVVFSANFADIVSVFTLTTAPNFKLRKCEFVATAVNMNFKYIVDTDATTNNAKGLTIEECKWIEPDTATLSMVKLDGDNSDLKILKNFVSVGVNNNNATLVAIITGKSAFNADISDNKVYRLNTDTATGAILVTTDQTDNSGIISGNLVQHADVAAELLVTASSGFGVFNNYASGVAGASGYLLPGADS